MHAQVLPKIDTSYLDRFFFNSKGEFQAMPSENVRRFDLSHIQTWCHVRSRYNLPTLEQVEKIKTLVGGRPAIEIGAGMGDLGSLLGIPMTDSYSQTTPEMRMYYASLGQPIISPPPSVEKLDALEAVKKYKPEVVVAAWVTQLFQDGDTEEKIGSSVYGVDELRILDCCQTYIFIGNAQVHKDKRILKKPHETHKAYYLLSRSLHAQENVIWVWSK